MLSFYSGEFDVKNTSCLMVFCALLRAVSVEVKVIMFPAGLSLLFFME